MGKLEDQRSKLPLPRLMRDPVRVKEVEKEPPVAEEEDGPFAIYTEEASDILGRLRVKFPRDADVMALCDAAEEIVLTHDGYDIVDEWPTRFPHSDGAWRLDEEEEMSTKKRRQSTKGVDKAEVSTSVDKKTVDKRKAYQREWARKKRLKSGK